MAYCPNCGGRLHDNGICPNCGSMSEAKVQPGMGKTDVLNCLRLFFSDSPLSSVKNAARTKSVSVWIVFGVIFLISSMAAFMGVLSSADSSVLAAGTALSDDMLSSFVSLIAFLLLISTSVLLIMSLLTLLMFALAEERPSFSQALNITAVSLFPASICMIIAAILSLLSPTLAVAVIFAGLAVSAVAYYFGIQKASIFKKSPFWLFAAVMLLVCVLVSLISAALSNFIF